jgi:ATP-dependent Clp protease ATP-binding subunit ClpA
MFERFTRAARAAVIQAQEEARDLGQSPIGTEHLLLALLADPQSPTARVLRDGGVDAGRVRAEVIRLVGRGPAGPPPADPDAEDAAALKAIGIDLDAVRRAIEENFGPGALHLPRETAPRKRKLFGRPTGHIPFSPRAKKVLELALREAIRLKHNYIASEHILLGIIREGNGLACRILTEAGADLGKLRTDATAALNQPAA